MDANVDRTAEIGRHLLVDFFGVRPEVLSDEVKLLKLLLAALEQAGFHLIDHCSHRFPGQPAGVTAVALLSESHATIHTYPEYEYLALDIFSCGRPEPETVVRLLAAALKPVRLETHETARGRDARRPLRVSSRAEP